MLSRTRVLGLSLLALMAVGAFASASAYATGSRAAGPFWYRKSGTTQVKISQQPQPESFKGKGGTQSLNGTIAGLETEIQSSSDVASGEIYNNPVQGQAKIQITYNSPKLVKPVGLAEKCEVKVGSNNVVKLWAHLAWKWNGEPKQLKIQPQSSEQKWEIIFTSTEIPIQQQTEKLPSGIFTEIELGKNCGVLSGLKNKVEGNEVGLPSVNGVASPLETPSTELTVQTPPTGPYLQHWSNGFVWIGSKVGLVFGGNPATLVGQNVLVSPNEIEVQEL